MPVPATHYANGHALTPPWPDGLETAVFAMGCFWGAERAFWRRDGVWSTAVGYVGGFTPNPTYEEVCSGRTGHSEAVLVVFDPAVISYDELLRAFWEGHNPTQGMRQGNDVGTQYRSGIYPADAAQHAAAEASLAGTRRSSRPPGTAPSPRRSSTSRPGSTPSRTISSTSEEPQRLLRARGHRRQLPDRSSPRRSRPVTAGRSRPVPVMTDLPDRLDRRLVGAIDRAVRALGRAPGATSTARSTPSRTLRPSCGRATGRRRRRALGGRHAGGAGVDGGAPGPLQRGRPGAGGRRPVGGGPPHDVPRARPDRHRLPRPRPAVRPRERAAGRP